jgi:gamma-glutamyltranspeptidase/glutathione hydrolase
VGPFEAYMGHAGALVRDAAGVILGASDPRGEGVVAAF